MDKNTRICIVGAGPGGLMSALTLRRLGYNHVTVLNRDACHAHHIGGKCHTVKHDEIACDTGAVFVLGTYPTVKRLAKQADIQLIKSPPFVIQCKDGSTRPFGCPPHPISFWKKAAEYIRIFIQVIKYHQIFKCSVGEVHPRIVKDLALPYSDWVAKYRLNFFNGAVYPLMRSFGFGYDEQKVPAVYILKCFPCFTTNGNWLSLWNPSKIDLYRIKEGYGGLWKRLGSDLDILSDIKVDQIQRNEHGGVVHHNGNMKTEFDKLILSCPLDEALKFLDASSEEKAIFSKIKCFSVWQAIVQAEGLGDAVIIEKYQSHAFVGHAMSYHRYNPEKNWYYFFGYTGGKPENEIMEILKKDIEDFGGRLLSEPILRCWKDFDPHFNTKDVADGYQGRLEKLQGKNSTYYSGALLNPFGVELVASYAEKLMKKHFP